MSFVESLVTDARSIVYSYLTYVDLVKLKNEPIFTEILGKTTEITLDLEKTQREFQNPTFLLRFPHLRTISGVFVRSHVTKEFYQIFSTIRFSPQTRIGWLLLLARVTIKGVRFCNSATTAAELQELYTVIFRPGNEFFVESLHGVEGEEFDAIPFLVQGGGIGRTSAVLKHLAECKMMVSLQAMGITQFLLPRHFLKKLANHPERIKRWIERIIVRAQEAGFKLTGFGVCQNDWHTKDLSLHEHARIVAAHWGWKEYPFVFPQ